jgi:hypothetical protein
MNKTAAEIGLPPVLAIGFIFATPHITAYQIVRRRTIETARLYQAL